MGLDKAQRPLLVPNGLEVQGNSTFRANVVLSTGARLIDHIQALTGASTGTQITNYGVTKIVVTTGEGTAANLVYTIAAPVAGVYKTIIADLNSTKEVQVRTATSAATFFGSTKNAFTFSTGSTYLPSMVTLMGMSTSQWAILDITTPLVATTSTAASQWKVTVQGATA